MSVELIIIVSGIVLFAMAAVLMLRKDADYGRNTRASAYNNCSYNESRNRRGY